MWSQDHSKVARTMWVHHMCLLEVTDIPYRPEIWLEGQLVPSVDYLFLSGLCTQTLRWLEDCGLATIYLIG